MEQKGNVNFCVKLQKSPSETLDVLKAVYGESTIIKSNVCVTNVSEEAEKM
jgi:hypothetical protein